jgi:hypothetical protein
MYPEQPDPRPDYSVDYLNEISGANQKTNGPSQKLFMIVAIVGVLVVLGFGASLVLGGQTGGDKARAIYLRLETLQEIREDQQDYLQSNELRAYNGTLGLFLTNALSDIETPLTALDINTKKLPKDVEAAESAYQSELSEKLTDARLNVKLDDVYAREMAFELATLRSQMKSLYQSTNSKSMKTFLEQTDDNIAPIVEKFTAFSNKEV